VGHHSAQKKLKKEIQVKYKKKKNKKKNKRKIIISQKGSPHIEQTFKKTNVVSKTPFKILKLTINIFSTAVWI